jgi:predicted nucleotidyltransferase
MSQALENLSDPDKPLKQIATQTPCPAKLRPMRPSEALSLHRTQIREIALRHRVSGVRVFGSALHGDDTANSDLDLLVEPTAQTTLMDIGAIRFELKQLLGMEVDVLTPNSLPASFREQVLREALAV